MKLKLVKMRKKRDFRARQGKVPWGTPLTPNKPPASLKSVVLWEVQDQVARSISPTTLNGTTKHVQPPVKLLNTGIIARLLLKGLLVAVAIRLVDLREPRNTDPFPEYVRRARHELVQAPLAPKMIYDLRSLRISILEICEVYLNVLRTRVQHSIHPECNVVRRHYL